MISPEVKKYAILMIASIGSKLGQDKFSIAMLCLMALGITASEITDAINNPVQATDENNPFIEMVRHATEDPDIRTTGLNMGDKFSKTNLN